MALKDKFASGGAAARKISENFDEIMFALLKVTVIAVALTAVHKYAGIRALGDGQAFIIYFGLGAAAVGLEYYGAQVLVDSWVSRKLGGVAFGGALCLVALAFSYSSAISSASVQQSQASGVQKANFRKNVNSQKSVEEAEFALKAAMEARQKLTPKRSAAESRAAIDSAQAHRWWANTDKCTAAKGPQRQAFCDNYRAAVADLALWDDISREDARIGSLQAKVDEARAQEAEAPATVSEVRADVKEYANWFGTDAEGGQRMQAQHISLTLTLFVTLMGFLTAWKRNQNTPRRPWGVVAWLKSKWTGEAMEDIWDRQAKRNEAAANGGTVIVHKTERVDDPRLQRIAARLAAA